MDVVVSLLIFKMAVTISAMPVGDLPKVIEQYVSYGREELKSTFGVSDSAKVPKHSHVWPKVKWTLDADGEPIIKELMLKNDQESNISPISIPLHLVDDPLQTDSIRRKCHYRSIPNDLDDTVHAAISNCDGQLRGTIITETEVFTLHPLPKSRQKYGATLNESFIGNSTTDFKTHVLIKRQSLLSAGDSPKRNEFCGIDADRPISNMARDSPISTESLGATARRVVMESSMTVEIAIFVDYEMFKRYWGEYGLEAESRLQDFVSTVFNNIQILYNHPTMVHQIAFKIVRYEVFKTQPDGIAGYRHREGDAQMYLDAFCLYQYGQRGRNWDQAFLFTGYDIHRSYGVDKSISGIARLYGACDPYNSCVLVEGHDFTSVFIATHELGHGFGMRHDEPYCPSTFIMSGSLGPGKVTWSACSVSDMGKYISKMDNNGKNCLRQTNGYATMSIDMSSLPGRKYDNDRQCAMMHGSGYRHVIPRNQYPEGACSMMWCGQSTYGRIITAHPALEGSICGDGRYCFKGKCGPWSYGPRQSPPRAIDGAWSDWSKRPCIDCVCAPFAGSLGILQSTRACTNPAPDRGGRDCAGDPVRGVVCNADCPNGGYTVESYIDGHCAMRQNEGRDPEMTGRGAQLKDKASVCKIFCDIRPTPEGKTFRFYGDLMPDGTPCGNGKYCVAGQCLQLSCDGYGVVGDVTSCPNFYERCALSRLPFGNNPDVLKTNISKPYDWSFWSSWSECSVTCGRGRTTRTRQCQGNSKCRYFSNKIEMKECEMPKCPTSQWSTWSSWSQCSTPCEKGVQTRSRNCDNSYSCNGPSDERRICNNGPCDNSLKLNEDRYWTSWSNWGPCSVTCGEGSQMRTRGCSGQCGPNAVEKSRELRPCYQTACAKWGPWGQWSECSESARSQSRVRKCYGSGLCPGEIDQSRDDTETQPCPWPIDQSATSAQWLQWSSWTDCTRSCGGGVRSRYRVCSNSGGCIGHQSERQDCAEDGCPINNRSSRSAAFFRRISDNWFISRGLSS